MLLRRLLRVALVACAVSLPAAHASVSSQCVASIKDANAPVLAPLAKVVGAELMRTVFSFITDTPFGKILAGDSALTCIANMNGTMLGQTVLDAIETPTCAPFKTITDVPFVKQGVALLKSNVSAPINDVLKIMKAIPSSEIDQFCGVYTQSLVPCIVSQLLPSLAIIRTKYSNGCCQAWNDDVLNDFGYSLSGQLTKLAQLFGDAVCATQTPAFKGTGSQRCGYTMLQTLLTKPDAASTASALLRNLQVPSSEMCLRAENQAYTDINNNKVDAKPSEPIPSGCVATIDRIASWVYGLPVTQKSEQFDMKALLEDDKCLKGSELFPTIKRLVPGLALSEVEVFFSKSCVHVPMKFAAKCTFSHPAALVEWSGEPSPVRTTAPATSQDAGSKTTSTSKTTAPTATTTPSSSGSRVVMSSVVSVVMAVASVALLNL